MSTSILNYGSDTLKLDVLEKPVVLLSIERKENRRLIQQFLPDHYSVYLAPQKINGEPFDICIIDEFSIQSNLEILRQIKKHKAPEFLPVMLLTSDNSSLNKAQQIWNFADDILSIPVSTGIFNSRIKMLLKSRRYSLALKEKNDRLQEEKEKFKLIAENSTDLISRHAPDGTYLYASPAARQLLGYAPEELIGQNAYEMFHPDDVNNVLKSHNKIFSGEDTATATYRIQTKKGRYKWVETHSRKVWNEKDELVEIQASTRDISDRKTYEQQLTHEKELLNTTIDSLPGIFYMLDSEMNLVSWNANFRDELGYTDEQIREKDYKEYFLESDYKKLEKKVKQVWTRGYADMEIDLLDNAGKTHCYYLTSRTMMRDGKMYIVGSGVDISARVEAEQELAQSKKRWEMLVQKDPGLVMLTTEEKEIKFVNPAGARLLGFENQNDIIGDYWTDHVKFEDEILINHQIQAAVDGKRLDPTTFKIHTHDGRDLYVELQKVPVEYNNQPVILTVGKDVTPRITYEQELERSLEEKNVLLQEIHHRVKNNLAIVSGLLELQSEKLEDPGVRALLTESKTRIHTIAKVHEMLYRNNELSRIDFKAYILELTETLSKFTEPDQKKINFEFNLDPVQLNIDQAVSCGMVVNELITNAIKHAFNEQDKGVIRIDLTQKEQEITLSVFDNGSGIPESFDLENTKTLGQTIIRLLVNQLQASFNYGPLPGTGTQFELSFQKRKYSGPSKKV